MKMNPSKIRPLILTLGIAAFSADARAQATATETKTRTETVAAPAPAAAAVPATVVKGTFTEYVGSTKSVLVKTDAAPAPVSYLIDDATAIVNEAGAPVELAILPKGSAVAVEYSQAGPAMMASRIVVSKPAPAASATKTTTVTTVNGQALTEKQKEQTLEKIEQRQERLEEIKEKLEK